MAATNAQHSMAHRRRGDIVTAAGPAVDRVVPTPFTRSPHLK
ncbi:hypothetical protein [Gordonia hankookensis]|nr:hypothetical protein [Gordonia hankookensis]